MFFGKKMLCAHEGGTIGFILKAS